MTIDPTELARLKALAEACPHDVEPAFCGGCSESISRCACTARYIFRGALGKPVVLALIAEVERLKAELGSLAARHVEQTKRLAGLLIDRIPEGESNDQ